MRTLFFLVSSATIALSGCATPGWTQKSVFDGHNYRYAVGEGEAFDPQTAEDIAQDRALAALQLSKAMSIAVSQRDSVFIRESINPMIEPTPEISTEEGNNLATEPSPHNKEEGIIEFLYDIFQENEKNPEPSTVPKESDAL